MKRRDLSFDGLKLLAKGEDTKFELVPSTRYPKMYLIQFDDGTLSYDSYNLTRAKENIQDFYLEGWQEAQGSPPMRLNGTPATRVPEHI